MHVRVRPGHVQKTALLGTAKIPRKVLWFERWPDPNDPWLLAVAPVECTTEYIIITIIIILIIRFLKNEFGLLKVVWIFFIIIFLYHHYLVVSYCVWLLGTHPVEDPPKEHLMASTNDTLVDDSEAQSVNGADSSATESNAAESGAANATQTSKPKRKSGRSGGPRKTPRLCDVIKQSNEQIKQLQETM